MTMPLLPLPQALGLALGPATRAPTAPDLTALAASIVEDELQASEAAVERVTRALEWVRSHPEQVADDPRLHDARVAALLWLAEIQLDGDDETSARDTVDELIRVHRGDLVPPDLSPRLQALVDERLTAPANAPVGSVQIHCARQCRVVLDERDTGRGAHVLTHGLPLGPHRLWIEDLQSDRVQTLDIEITADDPGFETQLFEPEGGRRNSPRGGPEDVRRLPRWAGALGVSLGIAAAIAGAVLIGIEDRCTDDLGNPREVDCPSIHSNSPLGPVLLGGGAALTIGFAIPLAIGESRVRARGGRGTRASLQSRRASSPRGR